VILVFKLNWPHWGPPGLKYDSKGVYPDDLDQALEQGWNPDFLAALGLVESHRDEQPEAPQIEAEQPDNSAPTRAELEQMATELGISFDGRTTDRRLAERIAEMRA
jgi:hypothetical protein